MYSKIRLGEPATTTLQQGTRFDIPSTDFGPGTTALLHLYMAESATGVAFVVPNGSAAASSGIVIRPGESIQYGPVEKADIPAVVTSGGGDLTYQFSSVLAEG